MISDVVGQQLHERASRGEGLTIQEQAQLNEWYANQDANEAQQLGLSTAEKTQDTLQLQVETALKQLSVVTKRIQEIASENELLRRENLAFRQQLAAFRHTQTI